MSHRAPSAHSGVPRIWLLPLVVAGALVFVGAVGWVSTALLADFVAWWPVWTLLLVLTLLSFSKRMGRLRLVAIVPVLISIALAVFVYGYFDRWSVYPSSSQELIGPDSAGVTSAALSARIDGPLTVEDGSGFLYEVYPNLEGGSVGIPSASEQEQEGVLSIQLVPPVDPGLYSFAGWDILLDSAPAWALTLEGEVEADLSTMSLNSLQVFGSGTVSIPAVDAITSASIAGAFAFDVPSGVPIMVLGNATVPSSWIVSGDEASSPIEGEGWVISVAEGSSLTVTER